MRLQGWVSVRQQVDANWTGQEVRWAVLQQKKLSFFKNVDASGHPKKPTVSFDLDANTELDEFRSSKAHLILHFGDNEQIKMKMLEAEKQVSLKLNSWVLCEV